MMKKIFAWLLVIPCFILATGCSDSKREEDGEIAYEAIEEASFPMKEEVFDINVEQYEISLPSETELERLEDGARIWVSKDNGATYEETYFSIGCPTENDGLYGMVLDDLFQGKTASFENFINTNNQNEHGEEFTYNWYQGEFGKVVKVTHTSVWKEEESNFSDRKTFIVRFYCDVPGYCELHFRSGISDNAGINTKKGSPVDLRCEEIMLHVANSIREIS